MANLVLFSFKMTINYTQPDEEFYDGSRIGLKTDSLAVIEFNKQYARSARKVNGHFVNFT